MPTINELISRLALPLDNPVTSEELGALYNKVWKDAEASQPHSALSNRRSSHQELIDYLEGADKQTVPQKNLHL